MAPTPQIVAMGGGGFSAGARGRRMEDHVLALTGTRRPRVCFLATASGDSAEHIARFRRAFRDRAKADHLPLFFREEARPPQMLLDQDVIYVGGGNTANMLLIWRLHGVDRLLRKAWRRGTILTGLSAGMNCWFEACSTDSFGPLAPLSDGLGFLKGSACPHFDGEAERRPTYRRMIERGLPAGYAADDCAALHFIGRRLHRCIATRPKAKCYRVEKKGGEVVERALETELLE